MRRNGLLWLGAVALLLLFGAWWYTAASAAVGRTQLFTPMAAPVGMVTASVILFWVSWRKGISGLFVLASTLLGMGALSFFQRLPFLAMTPWLIWLLLPAFVGFGILVENRLGFGWRFSDRQGFWMILASLGLFLCAETLFNRQSGTGVISNDPFQLDHLRFNAASLFNLGQLELPPFLPFQVWR